MSTLNNLYEAQKRALDSVTAKWFPCYRQNYVESQSGFKGFFLQGYSKAYSQVVQIHNGLDPIIQMIQKALFALASRVDAIATPWVKPVLDTVFPVNPVNGRRHMTLMPRSVDVFLGKMLFPLALNRTSSGVRIVKAEGGFNAPQMVRIVDSVVSTIASCEENRALLNPQEATEFEYKATTVEARQKNAFAVMGGNMAVFTGILEAIHDAIEGEQMRETTVTFADGSKVHVDLSSVRKEDVVAALLGHEMTHVASRHGIAQMALAIICSLVLAIARVVVVEYLKKSDAKYQKLKGNVEAQQQYLVDNYSGVNRLLEFMQGQARKCSHLFHSRKNEYEADITSVYLAKNAGYNPLGALMLQEILAQDASSLGSWFHRNFEFLTTHPYGEHRKRALLTAISSLDDSFQNLGVESPEVVKYEGACDAEWFVSVGV